MPLPPTWQHLLLRTDEVDDNGAKYEPVEEHDGLEASVAEESAHDAKHKIKSTNSRGVGIIGTHNFQVFLK